MSASADEKRPARVFVVEDDPAVRLLLEYQLARAGYRVESAKSGELGLEGILRFDPDAVVLDCNLPGIDGDEVVRAIRRRDGDRRRVIVILSGALEGDPRLEAMRLEADSLEAKPISFARLNGRLASLNVPPKISTAEEGTRHVDLY